MRPSYEFWALAACVVLSGSSAADGIQVQKATPHTVGPLAAPKIGIQGMKTWMTCVVYAAPGAGPSTRIDFINDTGKTLPSGTRVEWEVAGTPAGCCKGSLNFHLTQPNDHVVYNTVLNPGQIHGTPCKAWVHIPAYGADYFPASIPTLAANQMVTVHVKVRNQSGRTWPANGVIRLAYHWYQGANVVVFDGQRTFLPTPLAPGQEGLLLAKVTTPSAAGTYTLKWDMVEENVTWFSWKGVPTRDQTVIVAP